MGRTFKPQRKVERAPNEPEPWVKWTVRLSLIASIIFVLLTMFDDPSFTPEEEKTPVPSAQSGEGVVALQVSMEVLPDASLRVLRSMTVRSEGFIVTDGVDELVRTSFEGVGNAPPSTSIVGEYLQINDEFRNSNLPLGPVTGGFGIMISPASGKLPLGLSTIAFQYLVKGAVQQKEGTDELNWDPIGRFAQPLPTADLQVKLPQPPDPSVVPKVVITKFSRIAINDGSGVVIRPFPVGRAELKGSLDPEGAYIFTYSLTNPLYPQEWTVVSVTMARGTTRRTIRLAGQ